MTLLAPLSELDAVNEMLSSIGQSPVSSISIASIGDVNIAKAELLKVTRQVQLHGFAFNTDEGYVLTPDIDGFISVPQGVLRIDPMDPRQRLVARMHPDDVLRIWDSANLTWTISEPVAFRISWGFPFEQLPASARSYIAISAARKFQARTIGSRELDQYNAEDEARAWALLVRDERSTRDTNLFRNNQSLGAAGHRRARR